MTERGTLLGGRYQLEQVIGRGGMAEVWRARDRRLERDVAVKRLRVDLASDPTFQARFRREAQSAAGLNHPNIVAVYDTGEEREGASDVSVPYIVMELVEGVTLREVLRDGRKILPERALEFTSGVLDALAYSHRAGIIHRDIKPANVMLTPGGTVKVMDFGIARAVADTSATMTQTAAVIGTAQYLSPEQARGEKVDNRSDIYAVGCLLYELLTSQPLFKGDSPVSVAYQHVREIPVPPSQVDAEVTPAMDAVVMKALEKDPRDRYQDAFEMREDIQRALRGEPVLAAAAAADQATQLIPSDPMTTTARRASTPPPPPVMPSPALAPASSPVDVLDEPEERKSRKGLVALLVITALVLIGIVATILVLMNPPAREVTEYAVPPVRGATEIAAREAIENANLVAVVNPVPGTDDDKGFVVEQRPDAGEMLPAGSEVTIDVSQGPTLLTVPDGLTKVPVATAEQILRTAGFENFQQVADNPETEDPEAVKGNVTSTDPASGAEVSPDTVIELTVATGQSLVPILRNLTLEEAYKAAEDRGFRLRPVEEENQYASPGTIFDQDPAVNTPLDRGSEISVKVAVAPPEPEPSPDPTTESPTPEPPVVESTPPVDPPASEPVDPEPPAPDPSVSPTPDANG
ncbi:Stk1 family PASTA domain-containing Ser/Thr kinase [Tessaracoccus flavus]|uniref:non-specific serine/threonine protein kinase n=1 Tax=Tessaracoccus flavus TaxID=1610493 RepID=A0A1Q2CHM0_9ACTN|nr:Stk1 family PASTA domain-containing Ser/Thr kinase [Tessaracoccus flavus]AQP45560.1 hypothetical protein RPIT_12710 [Tessaracoccus flavus]SDY79006.1 serine/threonine protein kinase [Tessaracoccus flavus]